MHQVICFKHTRYTSNTVSLWSLVAISLQKDPAIHVRSELFAVMEPDEARTAAGLKRARIPPMDAGCIHICGCTTYTPWSFLLIHCTMHSATMRVHRETREAPAHTNTHASARARYDQVRVITRKHKLTICPGVLVSLATSRVRCNNWYTLSSATTPPTTNPPARQRTTNLRARTSPVISPWRWMLPQLPPSKFDVSAYSGMEKSIESENSTE